jgi:glycerate dehydrogenase
MDYTNYVAAGKWKNSVTFSPFEFPTFELYGKNIGIIGYGSIGKRVASIANAFNMNVYVYSRTVYNDRLLNLYH